MELLVRHLTLGVVVFVQKAAVLPDLAPYKLTYLLGNELLGFKFSTASKP